jgi:tRNA pseudouridine55 synthase
MSINGILNVNKPDGQTSFSVVALIRYLSGEKHVGHAGTLDPLAKGVLPVCIGQATRVVEFLSNTDKTYLAQIELGVTTTTFDREGEITSRKDPDGITATQVENTLSTFRGSIEQSPPRYSALKHQGRRHYELARAGIYVETKPRQIKIFSIELIDCKIPLITINVKCSKGTYIRSLAHDIGQYLGCGGYLTNLTRTQCGPFHIENALPLSDIKCIFHKGTWNEFLYPIDTPLLHLNAVIVDKTNELAIKNGSPICLGKEPVTAEGYCRAYNADGQFLSVLHYVSEKDHWHPDKVFSLS